jgi:hypothetical protein
MLFSLVFTLFLNIAGVGFGLSSKVLHVPAGETNRCVRSSNEAIFNYKKPFISNMKADLAKVDGTTDTKVLLTVRGTGVDDNGQRLNPTPTYPYDLGGSYGSCSDSLSSDCLVHSKIMLYNYNADLNQPLDQDLNSAYPCDITSWTHNMVECHRLFQNGVEPRGNIVLYTGWNLPSWWYRLRGTQEWKMYSLEDSNYIESLFPISCRENSECLLKCQCACTEIKKQTTLPSDVFLSSGTTTTTTHVISFSKGVDNSSTTSASSELIVTKDLRRMCGSPSNVKRFAQSSPILIDACVKGGTWSKSGESCVANQIAQSSDCGKLGGTCTAGSIPNNQEIVDSRTSIHYTLPTTVNTVQPISTPQQLLLYGKFLVFNGKIIDLTVHLNSIAQNDLLLPPVPYVDNIQCTNVKVYGLDKDGNCESGCGILCDLPSGQGKDNVITAVSEKERISNSHFRLNYKKPTLMQTSYVDVPTLGLPMLEILGNNFGLNATVRAGFVPPYFDGPKCLCDSGMVCGHDTTAKAASSSAGGRGCFLRILSQTHTSIIVELPQGTGTNIPMTIIAINQLATATLSFAPPLIKREQERGTGPMLQSTTGSGVITLFGTHFGAHPLIADTYNIGTVSHLVVDSILGPQRSTSTHGLKVLAWNHSVIQFQTPEGDSVDWDLILTTGGQRDQWEKALSYYPPLITQLTPNKNVMTDGKDGALIVKVSVLENGQGSIEHVGFDLQPPVLEDIVTIYHCNENVDGSYKVIHINTTTNGNSVLFFQRIGDYISGNWTDGYVSGGKPVLVNIKGLNFGVQTLEILLNNVVFATFQGRESDRSKKEVGANSLNSTSSGNIVKDLNKSATRDVVGRSHTSLTFEAPAGVGSWLVMTIRVGKQLSDDTYGISSHSFSYLPPHVFSIVPDTLSTLACVRYESPFEWEQRVSKEFTLNDRLTQSLGTGPKCIEPATLQIFGMSLGTEKMTATNGPFGVCVEKIGCANEGSTPYLGTKEEVLDFGFDFPKQTHSKIVVMSPVGSGASNSFQLRIAGQSSNNVTLFYKKPVITSTDLNPYDARGPDGYSDDEERYDGEALLEIRGSEFGGQRSEVVLMLSGKECSNAVWHPYHLKDGFPYITCLPQADVVGRKNATLIVAEQSVSVGISVFNSMFQSICHPGPSDLEGKTELYWYVDVSFSIPVHCCLFFCSFD